MLTTMQLLDKASDFCKSCKDKGLCKRKCDVVHRILGHFRNCIRCHAVVSDSTFGDEVVDVGVICKECLPKHLEYVKTCEEAGYVIS